MAKTPQKPASKPSPSVIVGTLADWPLAPRIAKLVGLPPEAFRVACYQTTGNAAHLKAVKKAFFASPETIAPALAPAAELLRATLEACTRERFETRCGWGFHGSADPVTLRADLARDFPVRTPAEELAARRMSPEDALKAMTTSLAKDSIPHRKAVTQYLEGGPFTEALLEIPALALGRAFRARVESIGVVERRLLFLWARVADVGAPLPCGDVPPERGQDRFQAYVDELVAAGVPPQIAHDYMLVHAARTTSSFFSTAIRAWEHLAQDGRGFVSRVLSVPAGEWRLAELFIAVSSLPTALLDAGARALVHEVCAAPGLVPDRTISILLEDDDATEALGPISRSKATARKGTGKAVRVAVSDAPLVAFTSEADIAAQLTRLAVPRGASVAASAPAEDVAAAASRAERVRAAALSLSELSTSDPRPATEAQLCSLETFLGGLHEDLRVYFGVTAKPGDGLAPTGTETSALSLDEALRETKALRKHGADPGLLALFSYGSGDYACFDGETAKIVYWDHETRGTSDVDPDLAVALQRLVIGPARRARGGKKRRAS